MPLLVVDPVNSIIECAWDFPGHWFCIAKWWRFWLFWSSVVCIVALQRRNSKLNEH
jgi:hypothetical protein